MQHAESSSRSTSLRRSPRWGASFAPKRLPSWRSSASPTSRGSGWKNPIGATEIVRPEIYRQLLARPWAWPLALLALAGLIGAPWLRDLPEFIASSAFLAGTHSFVMRPMKRSITAPAAAVDQQADAPWDGSHGGSARR
jgi:hypothetical protein